MTQAYRTAAAFKQALEQQLRTTSASGVDFARRRQLVVFDRFLARVALELGDAVTVTLRGASFERCRKKVATVLNSALDCSCPGLVAANLGS